MESIINVANYIMYPPSNPFNLNFPRYAKENKKTKVKVIDDYPSGSILLTSNHYPAEMNRHNSFSESSCINTIMLEITYMRLHMPDLVRVSLFMLNPNSTMAL